MTTLRLALALAASAVIAVDAAAQSASPDTTAATLSTPPPAGFRAKFRDEQDGAFDLSNWLLSRGGFLLVPTLVTEPALGYGIAGGLVFLQRNLSTVPGTKVPPNIYCLGGMYTQDGSWAGAAAFSGNFSGDRIRAVGAVLYGDLDLEFFGIGGELAQGLDYDIEGFFMLEEGRVRLGNTSVFLGGRYLFMNTQAKFEPSSAGSGIRPVDLDSRNAGLASVAGWDSRDNIFTPNRGVEAQAHFTRFDDAFGGDFDYWKYDLTSDLWAPVASRLVLGWHVDGSYVEDAAPFYGLPYVSLRGVPAAKYQGQVMAATEIETRLRVHRRWSAIGFAGLGGAARSVDDLGTSENVVSGGFGIRYFMARKLDLHGGVDFAWSNEDFAFYIQVGDAWR